MYLLLLLAALLAPISQAWTGVPWTPGPVLDQQVLPECVSYATDGALESAPYFRLNYDTHTLYEGARQFDGLDAPDSAGTTVPGELLFLVHEHIINTWQRTDSISVALNWLSKGPIIISGHWWYLADTYHGYLTFYGNESKSGHAFFCYGATNDAFMCQNSWGTNWGNNGRMLVRFSTITKIITGWGGGGIFKFEMPLIPVITTGGRVHGSFIY